MRGAKMDRLRAKRSHPTLYCDTRLGGVPRWVLGDPTELSMRIPDGLLDPPVFLCVEVDGRLRTAGTAFVLGLRGDRSQSKPSHHYLVTARHCVEQSKNYGDLYVRLNKTGGGIEAIKLDSQWHYPEHEADDIAVMPFPSIAFSLAGFDTWPIEIPVWCLADETIAREVIGVGDEVVVVGLFTHRDGKHQNRPIVRSGIIAAMPDEPLEDVNSGLEYDAYLAEIRSVGGLSGSPVFVVLPPGRVRPDGTFEMNRRVFYLMGVVRGHWNKRSPEFADFMGDEIDQLNTGIAIVTPIQKAVDIVMNREELVKERKEYERDYAKMMAPTEDSALPEGDDEFDSFENLARKLVRVPKEEVDQKRAEHDREQKRAE
jgi:hypothetical protein